MPSGRRPIPITPLDILRALSASDGELQGAAARLGISARTLKRRMTEYGIKARTDYRVEVA